MTPSHSREIRSGRHPKADARGPRELREDVQDLVVSAHKMADLANYVKAYPWLCVGAALAAGYLDRAAAGSHHSAGCRSPD